MGRKVAVFSEGRVPYDVLAYVPPHRAPAFVERCGLASKGGFVPVDPHYLITVRERVYAIGDVTEIPLARGGHFPKEGVFAHLESLVVAANVAREVEGKPRSRRFSGAGFCIIEMGNLPPVTAVGNCYAAKHGFRLLPRLRAFTAIKTLVERNWLRERE